MELLSLSMQVDDPYGYNYTLEHFDELLATLGSSYVDLLLIHWAPAGAWFDGNVPPPEDGPCIADPVTCRQDTWRAMMQIFSTGKARAIGVANFEKRHIEDILAIKVRGQLLSAIWQMCDGGTSCRRRGPSAMWCCSRLGLYTNLCVCHTGILIVRDSGFIIVCVRPSLCV